ncbi:hypothetical protein PoB_003732000 [Plakobranchus ocellatus]|uniref:Secreted protein n=1 Tax=Plakobranchus ocellatus TaxID=259542 RepID=A0AAV4AV92_9GAST|nr:hypothetical protein PoB_003732000 [Plakobranchus ocellatus]
MKLSCTLNSRAPFKISRFIMIRASPKHRRTSATVTGRRKAGVYVPALCVALSLHCCPWALPQRDDRPHYKYTRLGLADDDCKSARPVTASGAVVQCLARLQVARTPQPLEPATTMLGRGGCRLPSVDDNITQKVG